MEVAKFAETLADAAGDIARKAFASAQAVSRKADKSFVTETDKAIESAIAAMIRARYPDHGIFGEEHGRINEEASHQWVIDPIDGTSAFIAGIPTFTTLIALCENGKPVFGLIDQPILKERWVSTKIKALGIRQEALGSSVLGTTSMAYFTDAEAEKFSLLRKQCGGTVHAGDAYLYAKLSEGRIGLVADAGMKPYDFCALVPIVEAAGGVITDWQGKPLTLASKGDVLAAGSGQLHAEALALLQPVTPA